jgi:hypothetical protein
LGCRCLVNSFFIVIAFTSEIRVCFYSEGLHSSYAGGPIHYTAFGFRRQGDMLNELWSMHIGENGSIFYYHLRHRHTTVKLLFDFPSSQTTYNNTYKRHQTVLFLLSLIVVMLLKKNVIWNGLYSARGLKRVFAETRILAHFTRLNLSRRGVNKADVRYEFCTLRCCAFNAERFLQANGLAWGEWRRRGWGTFSRRFLQKREAHCNSPCVSDGRCI